MSLQDPSLYQACYKGLRYYLSHGVRSIDIGIMQVNWHYHRKKLVDPWRALDPVFNVRVGAQILKDEYRKAKFWHKAIGRYHSPGQKSQTKETGRLLCPAGNEAYPAHQ